MSESQNLNFKKLQSKRVFKYKTFKNSNPHQYEVEILNQNKDHIITETANANKNVVTVAKG
ncbi:MAG: hypothetical protein JEZ03_08790 [Bacteroidales bacterium]|nr:hypothetical protein [Bacteroidales bacterium]